MPEESKHSVILAKNSHISDILLRHIHQDVGHAGRNHMLSKSRQKVLDYWCKYTNKESIVQMHHLSKTSRMPKGPYILKWHLLWTQILS